MKNIKSLFKSLMSILWFRVELNKIRVNQPNQIDMPFATIIMWFFTMPLFVWCAFFTVYTPFQMPYDLPTVIQFVLMSLLYTIFLGNLIFRGGEFDFGWFAYTLAGTYFLWWHHPEDIIQPHYMWVKRLYSWVDFMLYFHTVFYNIVGFWCIFCNAIRLIKNGKKL